MILRTLAVATAAVVSVPTQAAQYFGHLDGTFINGGQTYWDVSGGTPSDHAGVSMAGQKISIDFNIVERKNYQLPGCSQAYCFYKSFYDVSLYFRANGPLENNDIIWTTQLDSSTAWDSTASEIDNRISIDFGPSGGNIFMPWPFLGSNIEYLYYNLDIHKGHGGKVSGGGNVTGRNIPEYEMSISGDFVIDSGTFSVRGNVPEASTWLMLIIGFGAIGTALRNRSVSRTAKLRILD